MTPEQKQAITDLRSRNLPPKLIAKQLGLRPAKVSAVIRENAVQVSTDREASGELAPVFQCLVNQSCLVNLLPNRQANATTSSDDDFGVGFAAVMMAREVGFNRLDVIGCLVDYWCLGVKDTLGPRQIDLTSYRKLVEMFYGRFPNNATEEISLELAQAIVFGGVAYAESLGFQPHRDFALVRELLGQWDGQPQLIFGREGKPFYSQGPYDNPSKIIKTLNQSVGEGNYHFLIEAGRY
jgi:hypothetical protein